MVEMVKGRQKSRRTAKPPIKSRAAKGISALSGKGVANRCLRVVRARLAVNPRLLSGGKEVKPALGCLRVKQVFSQK